MSRYEKMIEENPGKYPENLGKKWEEEERKQLIEELKSHKSIEEIAKNHKRTENGIISEIKRQICDLYKDGTCIDDIEKKINVERKYIEKTIKLKEKQSIKIIKDVKENKSNPFIGTLIDTKIEHIIEDDSTNDKLERIEYKLNSLQTKVDLILEYLKSIQ